MNDAALEEFLWWMCERQRIFKRREILQEPPPWTEDEVLQAYHFCNVYRELDAATQYLLHEIISQGDERDVFFNVVWFRLLNHPPSYEAAGGFTPVDKFDPEIVVTHLEAYAEDHTVFSPAYRISAHRFADSDSKIENVVYGIVEDDLLEHLDIYYDGLRHCEHAEEAFNVLKQIRAVGDFLAYELFTDLQYGWLSFTENHFVNVGPGAEKGLELIFDDGAERHIWWMMENQEFLFDKYDLKFCYWNGDEEKRLSLRDFEHSLCEFQKYRRVKDGVGSTRKFNYELSRQQDLDEFH